MTTIVEKEAIIFSRDFLNSTKLNSLENLKEKVTSKLYFFNREKDKLFFLNILRKEIETNKLDHEKICKLNNCPISNDCEIVLFVIDQEIEDVSKYYTFQPKNEDEFTIEERVNLHNKLNQIAEKLSESGHGQQIIFEEIESLKENFNLGKRNWFQFLKGKLMDLVIGKILDETIIKGIFYSLKEGFDSINGIIEK